MRRIVLHGKKYKTYHTICDCGCMFLYESEDVINIFGDSPWVRCPECDATCLHSESNNIGDDTK